MASEVEPDGVRLRSTLCGCGGGNRHAKAEPLGLKPDPWYASYAVPSTSLRRALNGRSATQPTPFTGIQWLGGIEWCVVSIVHGDYYHSLKS